MTAPKPVIPPEVIGRQCQIIAGALIGGVVMFLGVALVVAGPLGKLPDILSLMAAGFAGLCAVLHFVVPGVIAQSAITGLRNVAADDRKAHLGTIYLTKTIVGAALLEGATLFNVVAIIAEKSWLSLGVVIVLLAIMAMRFPSQTQFENWADEIQRHQMS